MGRLPGVAATKPEPWRRMSRSGGLVRHLWRPRLGGHVRYLLLIYNCDRQEPGDPGFDEALARVNAFADECRRRGVFVGGDPVQPESTATTVSVREGRTLITDGPFIETHEHL